MRIFNPDGSEAELSGNGVREAVMYLRRHGWADSDSFSLQTAAGEVRPTITGPTTCTVDMGRASLTSKDFPVRRPRGDGVASGARAGDRLPARLDRQPPVRDRMARGAGGPRPVRAGRADRAPRAVSQPHERVVLGAAPATARSGRGSSSAGWGDDVLGHGGHRGGGGRGPARGRQPRDRAPGRRRPRGGGR
ncbi:MAG: hypothetical protein WKF40_03040 [Thermoleophilaceae bacterium]